MPEAHLDDEQLSALLDRDAPDEHVRSCAACRGRLDALTAAAELVGAPVRALAPAVVDRLVLRALDTADAADASRVVAFDPGRRRGNPLPALAAAAAAVVVLVLTVPALLGGSQDGSETAATGRGGEESSVNAAPSLAAGTGGASGDDEAATSDAAGGSASVAAPVGDVATRQAALLAFDSEADLVEHLIAVMSTTAPAEGADDPTPEVTSSCEETARKVGGTRLGGRTYVAPLRWRTTEAEVHVFELTEPVDGAARQAYVMASRGCRVLAEPRF